MSSHQSDNSIFLDVVGGVDKKGRIFGLGPEAGKYKPSASTTSYDGVSPSEYQQMRTLVTNLSDENKSLKEQLQSHEELIRASQEESRLVREQLLQFMESFSLSHPSSLAPRPNPPQPPPTNQDNQQDDDELDDDLT